MRHRNILHVLTLTLLATTACNAPESGEDRAPAEEQPRQTAEASIFPNAPSPVVREAVVESALEVEEGQATFYADQFEGRRTASGRTFRQSEMVAAHRAFPFGTRLKVTNTRNDREVEVRVVDRGPFGTHGNVTPVLDLSRAAAERLDFISAGRAQVKVEVLEWGEPAGRS